MLLLLTSKSIVKNTIYTLFYVTGATSSDDVKRVHFTTVYMLICTLLIKIWLRLGAPSGGKIIII